MKPSKPRLEIFEQTYPNLSKWVNGGGWLEIGAIDNYSSSFIAVLDEGGMVWKGKKTYPTIDAALRDAEKGIRAWVKVNLGEDEVI